MRPNNLTFPYSWQERRPILHEGVLIIPPYYKEHEQWGFVSFFKKGKDAQEERLHIEYCSGNGDWVIKRAKSDPSIFWIGVEKQFKRVRKIWSKMHNEKIKNLLIVCGDAQTFTQYYLPSASAHEIYINFPDPWPKERHKKHRLIQPSFIAQLSRVVKKGGGATFLTDSALYSEEMIELMQKEKHWSSLLSFPYFVHAWENYGTSWFQDLWEKKGRKLYYVQYCRK